MTEENLPCVFEHSDYCQFIFLTEKAFMNSRRMFVKGLRENQYLINRTIKPRLKRDRLLFDFVSHWQATERSIAKRHGISAVIKVRLNWNSFAWRTSPYFDMVCILCRNTCCLSFPSRSSLFSLAIHRKYTKYMRECTRDYLISISMGFACEVSRFT